MPIPLVLHQSEMLFPPPALTHSIGVFPQHYPTCDLSLYRCSCSTLPLGLKNVAFVLLSPLQAETCQTQGSLTSTTIYRECGSSCVLTRKRLSESGASHASHVCEIPPSCLEPLVFFSSATRQDLVGNRYHGKPWHGSAFVLC